MAPAVEAAVRIPLLHIADPTAAAIHAAHRPTVGLLATRQAHAKRRFGTERIEQYPQAIGTEAIGPFSCVTRW